MDGIGGARLLYERLAASLKLQIFFLVDGELSLAVLYLAKIRHAVVPIYHQVYLRPGVAVVRSAVSPAENPGDDSANPAS